MFTSSDINAVIKSSLSLPCFRGIQGYWSPDSYLFYNALFILTLLWGIHSKESDEPLQIVSWMKLKWNFIVYVWILTWCFFQAVIINVLSILFDVIVLAAYFPASFREFLYTYFLTNHFTLSLFQNCNICVFYRQHWTLQCCNDNPQPCDPSSFCSGSVSHCIWTWRRWFCRSWHLWWYIW